MHIFNSLILYALAAVLEIMGCFAFWAWLRMDRSPLWLIPGALALMAFAWILTRIDLDFAGRAYAAYGGIYIIASLVWLWIAEQQAPTRWDIAGALLCLAGATIIILTQISKA